MAILAQIYFYRLLSLGSFQQFLGSRHPTWQDLGVLALGAKLLQLRLQAGARVAAEMLPKI